jgi:DNA-binding protein HU-beta
VIFLPKPSRAQIAALHNDKLVDKCAKARFFADFFFDTPFFLFSCSAPALAVIPLGNRVITNFNEGDPDTMNKNDLVGAVADASGLSKTDAGKAVEATFDAITGALKKGGEVRLVGFGTFAVAKRKASTGRNPRTGEEMKIPASNQPKFKAGKALKDAVN